MTRTSLWIACLTGCLGIGLCNAAAFGFQQPEGAKEKAKRDPSVAPVAPAAPDRARQGGDEKRRPAARPSRNQEERVIERAPRPERSAAPRQAEGAPAANLRQTAVRIQRHIEELVAKQRSLKESGGSQDDQNSIEKQIVAAKQKLEAVKKQAQQPDATRQPDAKKQPDAKRRPDAPRQPDAKRRPDAPRQPDAKRQPERRAETPAKDRNVANERIQAAKKRIEHLNQAARHLKEGGAPDLAEQVSQHAKRLTEEIEAAQKRVKEEEGAARQKPREPRTSESPRQDEVLRELMAEVRRLRADVNELRARVDGRK